MTSVITLICNPDRPILQQSHIEIARKTFESHGLEIDKVDWLRKSVACDIYFEKKWLYDASDQTVRDDLVRELDHVPVDILVQSAFSRKKKMLICDMDSTIIEQECIDEIAKRAGVADQIIGITEKAMAGELDFEAALKERVSLLTGLSVDVLEDVYKEQISLTPGAPELVNTMRRSGAMAILVSGGFTFFTKRVARACGFDFDQANELETVDGALTGKVVEPILDKRAKVDALHQMCSRFGVSPKESLALGDGANDLDMINEAGLGISFRGKPILKQAADIAIEHGDLTAVLYVQGFKEEEFFSG